MWTKKTFAAFLITTAFTLTIGAQQPFEGPQTALERLSKLNKIRQLPTDAERRLFTGELADSRADSFGVLTMNEPDKILLIDETRAVGRFQARVTAANDRPVDVYFYLKNEGADWKIYAVRRFAVPQFMEQLFESLNARANLNEADRRLYENLQLTLDTDKGLRAWFAENRASMDKLRSLLPSSSKRSAPLYVGTDDKQFPAVAALLKNLNLSRVSIEKNGNIEIVIGGVTDNTVGFIYSPAGKPPEITTLEYIWVEPLADNWYLFRTT